MFAVRFCMLTAAPLLYLLAVAAAAACLGYALTLLPIPPIDFSLSVTRGAQVLLLLSLFPIARRMKLGANELGFPATLSLWVYKLGLGFALGLLILGLHVAFLLALGAIKPVTGVMITASDVSSVLLRAAGVGLVVAVIEETIFRGALLAALRRFGGPWGAAAIASAYYALLHFLKSDLRPSAAEVDWTSGFRIFADGLRYMVSETPVDCLLALFCAGLFLGAIRVLLPASLPLCMGIHAGWVTVIKVARRLTNPDPQAPFAHLVGPYDQIIGYGAALWISLLLIGLVLLTCRTAPVAAD